MTKVWEAKLKEEVFVTRIFRLERHRKISPRNGQEHDFFVIDCPDWCNIIPLTDDNQVVMVKQQRHGMGQESLELPGGMIDPTDESPLHAASRELLEETGYRARSVEPIGVIAPNPAIQTNRCHSFLARGAERVGEAALEGAEDIEVVTVPLIEIPGRIASGEINHALVVVAFTWAFGLQSSFK
jgi:8-oxo-dGTP pyrophosphatase MutT (NUDIX family)